MWRFSAHAKKRVVELEFTAEEILAALFRPEVTYTQGDRGDGREVRQCGLCGLVVDPSTKTVITVVLKLQKQWEHGVDKMVGV